MKNLIMLSCFVLLLSLKSKAQVESSAPDTVVWGNVETNYPGGQIAYDKFVAEKAEYPKVALNNDIMGCSYLRFTIQKDGSLTDVKVFRGVGSGMDEAAVKLIRNSGKWTPSTINGMPVITRCRVAVNYVLVSGDGDHLKGIVNGTPENPSYLLSTIY